MHATPKFGRSRQVAFSMRKKVEKEIERQVAVGILEPIRLGYASAWYPFSRKMAQCDFVKITVQSDRDRDVPVIQELLTAVYDFTVYRGIGPCNVSKNNGKHPAGHLRRI